MSWFKKKTRTHLVPDVAEFNAALNRSVMPEAYRPEDIAQDFRRLFLQDDLLGKRVLHTLLTWCGEYDVSDPDDPANRVPPLDRDELQRWAGKHEIGSLIKAAMYANLDH